MAARRNYNVSSLRALAKQSKSTSLEIDFLVASLLAMMLYYIL